MKHFKYFTPSRSARDVTMASNPRHIPPTHNINGRREVPEQSPTPARQPRSQSPTPVSGFDQIGILSRPSPAPQNNLPDRVSARQIKADSFRYGGGRSAGDRSLQANINRKINQP
jgi:hypothetical protein